MALAKPPERTGGSRYGLHAADTLPEPGDDAEHAVRGGRGVLLANCGWPAMEIWLTKLETYLQSHSLDEAKALLEAAGLDGAMRGGSGGAVAVRGRGARRRPGSTVPQAAGATGRRSGCGTLVVAVDFAVEPGRGIWNRPADRCARRPSWPGREASGWRSSFRRRPGSVRASTRRWRWWPIAGRRTWESAWTCFTTTRGPASSRTWGC